MQRKDAIVLAFCAPIPKSRFTADFVYEPITAGWPPAQECREVTGEHRIREARARVIRLNPRRSVAAPAPSSE